MMTSGAHLRATWTVGLAVFMVIVGSHGLSATDEPGPVTMGQFDDALPPGACDACDDGYGLGGCCCDLLRPLPFLACVKDHLWPPPCLRHSSTHGRAFGRGGPLGGTSWLNRPLHAGWFAGTLWGQPPIRGHVEAHNTFFGGYQLGYDFDHYWGTQLRFGWASPRLENLTQPQVGRNGRVFLFDADLVYYPWGDSRIRPYLLAGLGLGRFDVRDESAVRQIDTLFALPIGIGVKHHFRRWLSLKAEFLDNLAFARGPFSTMHNLSLTAGVEVHFGARPKSYWPWNPSRHIW